jgi:hypothetical protein
MTWVAVAMEAKLTFLGRGQNGAIDPNRLDHLVGACEDAVGNFEPKLISGWRDWILMPRLSAQAALWLLCC